MHKINFFFFFVNIFSCEMNKRYQNENLEEVSLRDTKTQNLILIVNQRRDQFLHNQRVYVYFIS